MIYLEVSYKTYKFSDGTGEVIVRVLRDEFYLVFF